MQFGADLILKGSIDTKTRTALPRQPEMEILQISSAAALGLRIHLIDKAASVLLYCMYSRKVVKGNLETWLL